MSVEGWCACLQDAECGCVHRQEHGLGRILIYWSSPHNAQKVELGNHRWECCVYDNNGVIVNAGVKQTKTYAEYYEVICTKCLAWGFVLRVGLRLTFHRYTRASSMRGRKSDKAG